MRCNGATLIENLWTTNAKAPFWHPSPICGGRIDLAQSPHLASKLRLPAQTIVIRRTVYDEDVGFAWLAVRRKGVLIVSAILTKLGPRRLRARRMSECTGPSIALVAVNLRIGLFRLQKDLRHVGSRAWRGGRHMFQSADAIRAIRAWSYRRPNHRLFAPKSASAESALM
jgi:hypothetical protein